MAEGGDFAGAELADVIGQVRKDLETAQQQGDQCELKFLVERVSLEFTVQVRLEGKGGAKVRIGVVTAEAGGAASKDSTHRVTVELVPRQRDDQGGYTAALVGGDKCGPSAPTSPPRLN